MRNGRLLVYVGEAIADSAMEYLTAYADVTDDFSNLKDVDAMIIRKHPVTREDMLRAPSLRIISRHGIGCDMLDLEAAAELGIKVTTLPGANAESVAELAAAMMLALSRKLAFTNSGVRQGRFATFQPAECYGFEAYGKTLALVGTGHIAMCLTRIMKYGYGMRVIGYSRHLTPEKASAMGIECASSLEQMLREADYINISVPLTPETYHMIGAEQLALLKPTAILVNTARGGIVDETALYEALIQGHLFGAACDVFEEGEPPRKENPLLTIDNFIATPHCGPSTRENGERSGRLCVDNILKGFGMI